MKRSTLVSVRDARGLTCGTDKTGNALSQGVVKQRNRIGFAACFVIALCCAAGITPVVGCPTALPLPLQAEENGSVERAFHGYYYQCRDR
jgi:hypothetical protein